MQAEPFQQTAPTAPAVNYSDAPADRLLNDPCMLAVLDFDCGRHDNDDPRALNLHLPPWQGRDVREIWRVPEPVTAGRDGLIAHARGGGWLLVSVCLPDDGHDMQGVATEAYRALTGFLRQQPDYHVQRVWNYLDRINLGDGDEERYRKFCAGRLAGMGDYFAKGFPAATAVGHTQAAGYLQVYCVAAQMSGQRIENPRQVNAWQYPRQYGPVSPSFARGMRLPAGDGLAISGTAAICGHTSRHVGNLQAQLQETLTNLESLLAVGKMAQGLGKHSPLKVYVRHRQDMAAVDAFMARHLPDCPRLLVQADICRSELLVEIDGWHLPCGAG